MVKIAVGGCSFSDRRYNIKPWGEQVAEHYNAEYIHEAASAGSNYRMWRTLTTHIMNNVLSTGDVIVLQYTLIDRREAWTPEIHINYELEHISEPYDSGTIVRLTPHFDQFAKSRQERKLAECHNYFSNHQYNLDCFWSQHFMFSQMCQQRKIHLRYLNTTYDVDNRVIDIDGTNLLNNPSHCLDSSHLNQLGHDLTAQLVIPHLIQAIDPS
jgi:hypothetical protein